PAPSWYTLSLHDALPICLLRDRLGRGRLQRLHRRDVTASVEVRADRLGYVVGVVVVARLVVGLPPDLEPRRRVDEDRRLVEAALLDRRGVDDGLERAAGLPEGLRGAVELARQHALAQLLAHHRQHRAGGRV